MSLGGGGSGTFSLPQLSISIQMLNALTWEFKGPNIGRNLISFQSLGLDIQVPPDMKTYYVGQMSIDM